MMTLQKHDVFMYTAHCDWHQGNVLTEAMQCQRYNLIVYRQGALPEQMTYFQIFESRTDHTGVQMTDDLRGVRFADQH